MEALVLEYPRDAGLCEKAAMLSGKLEDPDNALFYFKKAFYLFPSFDRAKFICLIYLQRDQPIEAMPFLDYAIKNNTSTLNLLAVRVAALEVIQLKRELIKDSTSVPVLNKISATYLKMGNKEVASKYVEKTLGLNDKDKYALLLFSQIKNMEDHHDHR
jgi:tetratricopeptide (TPR) repeat protein